MHTIVYYVCTISLWNSPEQDVRHENDHLFHVTVTYIKQLMENKYKHEVRVVLFMIQYEFQCHYVQVLHMCGGDTAICAHLL